MGRGFSQDFAYFTIHFPLSLEQNTKSFVMFIFIQFDALCGFIEFQYSSRHKIVPERMSLGLVSQLKLDVKLNASLSFRYLFKVFRIEKTYN
jgi:hypothetical protein